MSEGSRRLRIAFITAGAAGRYCGNCLHDNALALALRRLGEDAVLIPTYTPIRVEGEDASEHHVFFNGLRVYLEEKWPWFRRPHRLLDRALANPLLLRLLASLGTGTDPRMLGELTVSMLDGERGHQAKELDELVRFLADLRPDIVHLSNVLLVGMARRIRESLGVPVVCGLQAEDGFIDQLPSPFRERALERVRERALEVDALVAVSRYYAEHTVARFGLSPEKMRVVLPGIDLRDRFATERNARDPVTVGFLGRLAPEKGLHVLCDVFQSLARKLPELRLAIAGYVAPEAKKYLHRLKRSWRANGLQDRVKLFGTVDLEEKRAFLSSVDLLCLPGVYPDPKGLAAIEGLAWNVPFVAPEHGVFPELVELTGGGLLSAPDDLSSVQSLVSKLALDKGMRRELGARGRAAVLEHLSDERMAKNTLEVYRSLTR